MLRNVDWWTKSLFIGPVSQIPFDSEPDGIAGEVTWVNPLVSGKAWGRRLDDLMVSWVDSDSESDEACGRCMKDLEVSLVDSGYVELVAWKRPWESVEACCR